MQKWAKIGQDRPYFYRWKFHYRGCSKSIQGAPVPASTSVIWDVSFLGTTRSGLASTAR